MELVEKKLMCSKEASEMGDALVALVKNVKLALADGFQPGADMSMIVMASMPAIMSGVSGLSALGEESKQLDEFINAWMVSGIEIKSLFLKK